MKVLETSESLLKFCGLFSDRSNQFFKTINSFIFFSGLVVSLTGTSFAYVIKNISNLDESLKAFIPFFGGTAVVAAYTSVGANMKRIKHLHNELQKIVDDGKFKKNIQ